MIRTFLIALFLCNGIGIRLPEWFLIKKTELTFYFCCEGLLGQVAPPVAPILDVDPTVGYHGKINEKHLLVDMIPHLQVKNIDSISTLVYVLF